MNADQLPVLSRWPVLWIAMRYARAVQRTRGLSMIFLVSVAGLTLGVGVLITVLSVMNGFDEQLRQRILGMVPHVLLDLPADSAQTPAALNRYPGILGSSRYAEARAMLIGKSGMRPMALVGIEPQQEPQLSAFADTLTRGSLSALEAPGHVALGQALASRLGIDVGDQITFMLPLADAGSLRPTLIAAQVGALFEFGAQPDLSLAVMHVRALAQWAPVQLRLALTDVLSAPALAQRLAADPVFSGVPVHHWAQRHGQLFAAVGVERSMMGLLLGLVVVIAVFNIAASLAMMADEKRSALAILHVQGMSRRRIMRVFLLQALLIGVLGTSVGALLGWWLSWHVNDITLLLGQIFGFNLLAGSWFDHLPSRLLWPDVVSVMLLAMALVIISALPLALAAGRQKAAGAVHGP